MKYPARWIYLTDFFLAKRDVKQGGVEGYSTPFSFTMSELAQYTLSNKDEIIKMIGSMMTETVWTRDTSDEKHKTTVIERYEDNGGVITVFSCSTDQLNAFKEKIKKDLKESLIQLNRGNRTAMYRGRTSRRFYDAHPWWALMILHENFPDSVVYDNLWKKLDQRRPFGKTSSEPSPTERIKQVHNVIGKVRKGLKPLCLDNVIKSNQKDEGFRITT